MTRPEFDVWLDQHAAHIYVRDAGRRYSLRQMDESEKPRAQFWRDLWWRNHERDGFVPHRVAAHEVTFVPSGRGAATCPPDPAYPRGMALLLAREGRRSCTVQLPYPAPECGMWTIRCEDCGMTAAVTAAGRSDDPLSARIECKGAPPAARKGATS